MGACGGGLGKPGGNVVSDGGASTFGGALVVAVWLAVEEGTFPNSSSHGRIGY